MVASRTKPISSDPAGDATATLGSGCGFAAVAPPEVVLQHQVATPKADVWAIGCMIYGLVTGYVSRSLVGVPLKKLLKTLPLRFSSVTYSMLRMTLQPNPAHRCTAGELFDFISLSTNDDNQLVSVERKEDPAQHPKQILFRAKTQVTWQRNTESRREE